MGSVPAILLFGFLLGMRHATDADHVAALTTIVSREKSLRAAAPLGIFWGLGHTLTILLIGGAIVVFGLVIPPRLGLGMEFSVGVMLILLGTLNVATAWRSIRDRRGDDAVHSHGRWQIPTLPSLRAFIVGFIHGLAGSAAVSLLALGAIQDPWAALSYLVVFGGGTIAGMLAITTALALPLAAVAARFASLHRALVVCAGIFSIGLGATLVYEIGVVDGLFSSHPEWSPR